MNLPLLPDGYSWWVDEHDLRILEHKPENESWTSNHRYNDYEDKPDHEGRFFTATEEVLVQEYEEEFFIFWTRNRKRTMRGTKITNVRETVVSRLEYYDSMYLESRYRSNEATEELWRRIKGDGPNSLANIEGRAKALMLRFEAIQQNKKMIGHYPPKKVEDWI